MTIDEALHHLNLARPPGNKLACPQHEDKTPSLHLYTDHFYCYACTQSGDGYGLIAWYTGEPVGRILRKFKNDVNPQLRVTGKGRAVLQARQRGRRALADRLEPAYGELARLYEGRSEDALVDATTRWTGMQYEYECWLLEAETGLEREQIFEELDVEVAMMLDTEREIAAHAARMQT